MTERELLQSYVSRPAVQNALRVIRFAEGTERGGPDSYRVMFGGGLAPDLKRHPDKVIKGGGYSSAAAGAYQFMPPTWESQAKALGLSDFGPQNQDLAAVRLMRNRLMPIGGLSVLEKEGFSPKVSAALAPEWASLPTESGQSYYGQPVKKLSELQKVYGQAPQSSSASTSQSAPGQTSGLFQGLMSALAANQPKELSVKDLFKQELMSQALNPPRSNLLVDPFQMLLNTNLYE
jgi:muramidase (phage lysozyme)